MPFNQTFVLYYSDGNGFKTSTMRLGADVIVFSRCRGKDGNRFFHNSHLAKVFISIIDMLV
jgi:hypothetical protein